MKTFPLSVGRLDFLETLSAKNNDLFTLPEEVANLKQVLANLYSLCVETVALPSGLRVCDHLIVARRQ